ncbi:MAG TPA: DUF1028 domain-containing protein [Mycobacteriales bacterium]
MTFSIVARDRSTGELGVAVATSTMAVGRAAPWALAGVGVVVTQAHTSRTYGARGLELLAEGLAPDEVLDRLTADDPQRDTRQVAVADAAGRVAAWTGRGCLSACGHVTGAQHSVQGNTLRSRSVLPSMDEAFGAAEGPLAERLLAALAGAEEAGGDLRGRQSAAILVVSGHRTDTPWDEVTMDLRVDDAPDPVAELHRLVRLQRAYESGDLAVLRERAGGVVPELYTALDAVRHGDREAARQALAELRQRPGWEGVLRRIHSRLTPPADTNAQPAPWQAARKGTPDKSDI